MRKWFQTSNRLQADQQYSERSNKKNGLNTQRPLQATPRIINWKYREKGGAGSNKTKIHAAVRSMPGRVLSRLITPQNTFHVPGVAIKN